MNPSHYFYLQARFFEGGKGLNTAPWRQACLVHLLLKWESQL